MPSAVDAVLRLAIEDWAGLVHKLDCVLKCRLLLSRPISSEHGTGNNSGL